ncbi:MAG TPA: response regulator transcription factor [Pseudonocardiaceae bacterium]
MTAADPPARVLVVEDDERLAASVRRALEYQDLRVTVAHDGPTALAIAAGERPDLVILDVMLPGLDGIGVCRALRAAGLAQPLVLMLTARDATADRVAGLDAGADDYLVKPFEYDELLARVRALLRRGRPAVAAAPGPAPPVAVPGAGPVPPGPVLRLGDLTVNPASREVRRGDRPVELTALQFELLAWLLRHRGTVLTRQQLLDGVWGGGSAATSNVVDVTVGVLRARLEAGGEPRLLHTVRGVGYVLREC